MPPRHARRAVVRSVLTMRLAKQCLDAVQARLGDRGWRDPAGGDAWVHLYQRDAPQSPWIVCQPFVSYGWAHGIGSAKLPPPSPETMRDYVPADAPDGWQWGDPHWDPDNFRPDIVPKGPDMHGGFLKFSDGDSTFEVRYGDDGCMAETCQSGGDGFSGWYFGGCRPHLLDTNARPPQIRPHALLLRADLDVDGWPLAKLAEALCEIAPDAPGRVRMPIALPGGLGAAWRTALQGMRRALSQGQVPTSACWLAADGFAGTAVAWGASRDEALAQWEVQVASVRPKPLGWKQMSQSAQDRRLQESRLQEEAAARQQREAEALAQLRAQDEDEDRANNLKPLRKPGVDPATGEIIGRDGQIKGKSIGTFTVQFDSATVAGPSAPQIPWPLPLPAHAPCALVPLTAPPLPAPAWSEAGFEQLVRVLDDHGRVQNAWQRTDPHGFTLVGEHVMADFVPDDLNAELDLREANDAAEWASLPAEMRVGWLASAVVITRFAATPATAVRRARLHQSGKSTAAAWDPANVAPGIAWEVVRVVVR